MTTYTINVLNESGVSKSYIVFMQPPGGVTPIYTNVWATLENITDGGWDSVTYAPEGEDPPAPRVMVAEGVYTPGQIVEPSIGVNIVTVDFAERPQITATVTEHPDGGYSVAYA